MTKIRNVSLPSILDKIENYGRSVFIYNQDKLDDDAKERVTKARAELEELGARTKVLDDYYNYMKKVAVGVTPLTDDKHASYYWPICDQILAKIVRDGSREGVTNVHIYTGADDEE